MQRGKYVQSNKYNVWTGCTHAGQHIIILYDVTVYNYTVPVNKQ